MIYSGYCKREGLTDAGDRLERKKRRNKGETGRKDGWSPLEGGKGIT
jgi:hypothetical protein